MEGQNRCNSFSQLPRVERGTKMRCGPLEMIEMIDEKMILIQFHLYLSFLRDIHILAEKAKQGNCFQCFSQTYTLSQGNHHSLSFLPTHFIGKNTIQSQLVLIDKPIQRINLVATHCSLNTAGLNMNAN